MDTREQRRRILRAEMGARRAALSAPQVDRRSRLITSKLMDLEPLHRAFLIMGFASIGNEVDLRFWLDAQVKRGKTVLLPRVEKGGNLAAVDFKGWVDAVPGAFGIPEPAGAKTEPEEIDAVIVPGLVFDAHGYRLGYGKGYYDRFLKLLRPSAFICGVCYEFQVVDDIFPHAGDVTVDWIVTDTSELPINRAIFNPKGAQGC